MSQSGRGWPLLGPLQWIRYTDKQVKVKAAKEEEHRGWMLTVDPVSARYGGPWYQDTVSVHSSLISILKYVSPYLRTRENGPASPREPVTGTAAYSMTSPPRLICYLYREKQGNEMKY
uniref:Gem-associated protein 6 Sm-like domain-containing protein n=1 Tax=Stegastes partitus TaxID=144197 RepID=A0A3B5AQQ1_9TELE